MIDYHILIVYNLAWIAIVFLIIGTMGDIEDSSINFRIFIGLICGPVFWLYFLVLMILSFIKELNKSRELK